MTNVNPHELNYDHYSEDKYDRDIINSIPGHEELHQTIDEILERDFKQKKVRVLELGVGTGLTAIRLLRKLDTSRYVAVDFSVNMLNNATRKLTEYDVSYVEGDFSKIKFPRDNDLVVSVIGIHHQETDRDKKRLFRKIYSSLRHDGAFIFGDLVTYRDKHLAFLNDAKHFHHLVEHATDEETLKEWAHHHKYLNKLAPLEDQVDWLREVGFRSVDVVYNKLNTALIYAKK